MKYQCQAIDYVVDSNDEMLMCMNHWRMLPRFLQDYLYKHYLPRENDDWKNNKDFSVIVKNAVIAVPP
ncbi:MAG: hypothetical protein IIB73_04150 [Proteobacteria bacterium]|nr:hypothetical protein [Pseudomonadota bacterium]